MPRPGTLSLGSFLRVVHVPFDHDQALKIHQARRSLAAYLDRTLREASLALLIARFDARARMSNALCKMSERLRCIDIAVAFFIACSELKFFGGK